MLFRPALAAALLAGLVSTQAAAVPAFARRYKTACTTCHSLPPRLNPYGMAFRSNGYRLPAGEPRRQEDDVALGAPEWEALFPRAFLSGAVSDVPPVAGFLRMSLEREAEGGTDLSVLAVLLAAGNLGKHASYYVSGGFTPGGVGLGRAFVQIDQLAGPWLNVRAGQMEPALVPFSRQTQRLTYTPYLAFEGKTGGIELGRPRPALEVYGAGSDPGILRGLRYAVGLAERDGAAADAYARASYKFGGVAAAGDRSGMPAQLTAPLAETSLQVGAFAFRAAAPGDLSVLKATRVGADAMLLAGDLELDAAGWLGREAGFDATSWAGLAGAGVRPWPWLFLSARYEASWTPLDPAERRFVAAVRAALQQNVAVTVETAVELPHGDPGAIAAIFLGF